MPGGVTLGGLNITTPGAPPQQPKPGSSSVYTDKTGRTYHYGQTGPNGQYGYAPDQITDKAAPTMYQDPNSGNEYQWDPIKGEFGIFSSGDLGRSNRYQEFDTLAQRLGGIMGSGTGVSGSGSLPGGVAAPQLDQNAIDAGNAAAFSRAKDTVGATTGAALKSLKNQFAARGLRGSSVEGGALASAEDAGAGQLGDVSREQAIQDAARTTDLAKTQYQGAIQERGQDIGAQTAYAQIAANQQQNRIASILGLWNALGSKSGGMY